MVERGRPSAHAFAERLELRLGEAVPCLRHVGAAGPEREFDLAADGGGHPDRLSIHAFRREGKHDMPAALLRLGIGWDALAEEEK